MDYRLFVLLAVLACQLQAAPKDILIPALKDLFAYKCFKYGGVEKSEEFMGATSKLFACIRSKRKSSSSADQEPHLFGRGCNDNSRCSYECFKQFTDVLEPCLDPQEEYLIEFFARNV